MKRKEYLRKSHLEKNSSDKDKLSKIEKRSQQKSVRQKSKQLSKSIDEPLTDNYYENEMKMSWLCYQVSEHDSKYKCTCPNPANQEMVQEHLEYLNKKLIDMVEKNYGK